jgi:formamidopyrimidine-DNA glycosylase
VRLEAPPGPKYAGLERASGQTILDVRRRGKFLLLPLSQGDELIVHLGMTGVISPAPPDKHLRVKLELSAGKDPALYFRDPRRFGRFLVVAAGDYRLLPTLQALGPEPLEDAFTAEGFYQALQRSKVAVKSYLLSQRPVAGVGNIYADEALWRARIHPLAPANALSKAQAGALHAAIREVLTESLAAQGTTLNDYRTVNGSVGSYLSQLSTYGHEGDPCRRCGAQIKRIALAGRGTHFCPECQKR